MENGYLEPHSGSNGLLSQHTQDMHSPGSEHQVNPGFIQSPARKPTRPSELETSFSDRLGDASAPKPGLVPQINGSRSRSASTVAGSPMTPAENLVSYNNGTVQLPWHYYQYLQQQAANQNNSQNPDLLQESATLPLPQHLGLHTQQNVNSGSRRNAALSPSNPEPTETQDTWRVPNSAQIYEEIPGYKMYSDLPKVPSSSRPTNSHSDRSSDSLLRQPPLGSRKENPLYGENNNTDITDSCPLNTEVGHDDKPHRELARLKRCLCVAFLLLFIMSSTALVIIILSISGKINFQKENTIHTSVAPVAQKDYNSTGLNLSDLQSIKTDYSKLQNTTALLNTKLKVLEQRVANHSTVHESLQSEIEALFSRLADGTIDPTQCEHKSSQEQGRSETLSSPLIPATSSKSVVLAATCSTEYYQSDYLVYDTVGQRYQCRCSGRIEQLEDSVCRINYWSCPITQS